MEFDLYRICGPVHLSALIKQTHQRVSILSHRLLGVHSSEMLMTLVLDSGKPLFHVLQTALPLRGAHEQLGNQHISASALRAKVWAGTRVLLLVRCPYRFWWGADRGGNHIYRQEGSQQYALHSLYCNILFENETHLIGVEACEIICLPWIWPHFFLSARLMYNYPQMSDADSYSDKPI